MWSNAMAGLDLDTPMWHGQPTKPSNWQKGIMIILRINNEYFYINHTIETIGINSNLIQLASITEKDGFLYWEMGRYDKHFEFKPLTRTEKAKYLGISLFSNINPIERFLFDE